ncbi:hypothetical protein A9513_029005 [Pseudomonas sp. AU12215]|nr:hypothetical protein A9513_029005 [Pseudomonas sp. AU12215]
MLSAQLELNGTFRHTCRSAYGQQQIELVMKVERDLEKTNVTITMGGEKHSISFINRVLHNDRLLADYIDAIANGRVDSAAPANPRVLQHTPEPESPLGTEQQESIRGLVRRGGFLELEVGLEHPIRVMVHRTFNTPGICTILSIGARKPRTVCWTIRNETDSYCAKRLQESVEHLVTVATPKPARAA